MCRSLLMLCVFVGTVAALAAAQAVVRVEPVDLQGPRSLAEQTRTAAIRDYLQSWQSLKTALEQNQAGVLDADFVGGARDKLAATVQEQSVLGIRTRYLDRSHDIRFVFYSPEGLSIELSDVVAYDVQVFDRQRQIATQQAHARYIVVLTPSEVRWRVRVFQAAPE